MTLDAGTTGADPDAPPVEVIEIDGGARPELWQRRRLVLCVAAAAVLVSAGGLAGSTLVKSPQQAAADARAPASQWLTALVARKVLTSTIITRGTVAASATFQVTPTGSSSQGAATQVVTAVHVGVGDSVNAGQLLLDVSGRPVIVLAGPIPVYRDLKPGASGNDVAQLQDALKALGYPAAGDQRGYFGSATKRAATLFYRHLGYDVPTTGGPGDRGDKQALESAQSAVDAARRAVDDMQRQIDAAAASAVPTATATASAASAQEPLSLQMSYLRKSLTQAEQALADLIATTGPMVPMAEIAFLPSFPAHVTAVTAKVGAAPAAPAVTLSTGALGIMAQLTPDQGQLVKSGMKVDVVAESLGKTATARVATVGAMTTTPPAGTGTDAVGGGQGQSTGVAQQPPAAVPAYVPITVAPDSALTSDWAGQDVRITVVSAATRNPVLVVPVAAVSAGADGRTAVSVVGGGREPVRVPVVTGLSADGFVEVAPVDSSALKENDSVVIGQ